jgi:hypothetical protein
VTVSKQDRESGEKTGLAVGYISVSLKRPKCSRIHTLFTSFSVFYIKNFNKIAYQSCPMYSCLCKTTKYCVLFTLLNSFSVFTLKTLLQNSLPSCPRYLCLCKMTTIFCKIHTSFTSYSVFIIKTYSLPKL